MNRFIFPISLSFLTAFLCCATLPAAQNVASVASIELPETDDGLPGSGPIRRHDWFKKVWNRRRAAWQKSAEKDQKAVVFLGDSITQGWKDNMGGAFGEMKVANRGISGDTTRGMLIRLEDDVLVLNPTGIVMLMGTNDIEEGAAPETVADNVKLILTEIQNHDSELPVIFSLVFPSSETKKRPTEKIKKLNQLYAQIAKEFAQVTVIDTWALFADETGNAKRAEFPDLLHPNKIGYEKWSSAISPVLETLGLLPVAKDDFQLEPGYRSIFNGHDLTGWGFHATPANAIKRLKSRGRPIIEKEMTFDGQMQSSDGRYLAKDGRLIVTTPQEGRRVQQLWTTEKFPNNFTLKLEFRATPNADSGVFIRQPQLQCRDYLLAGPYKELKNYKAQDWNELVVRVSGNTAHCTCNGEVLETEFVVPETGPIGLEGDRGQLEYRRIRIKEER